MSLDDLLAHHGVDAEQRAFYIGQLAQLRESERTTMTDHGKLVEEYKSWARSQFLDDVRELGMDRDHVKEAADDEAYERTGGSEGDDTRWDVHYRAALDAYTQVARSARVTFDG